MIKVFIAGEGRNELGGWYDEEPYRQQMPGVIEAMLRKLKQDGWQVAGGIRWAKIRKYQFGMRGRGDYRNVCAAALLARENCCQVLAFVRDRDGNTARQRQVENAIQEQERDNPQGPRIIGGMAIEKLESWLLSMTGRSRSEDKRRPENELGSLGIRNTGEMVDLVNSTDLSTIPRDAHSLRNWLERARQALTFCNH